MISIGFVAGIFISSFVKIGISFSLFLLLLSASLFIFQKFFAQDELGKKKIFLLSLLILSFGLGILRYEIRNSTAFDENLESRINQKVSLEALVIDEPAKSQNTENLTVYFRNLIVGSSSTPVSGKGIVSTDASADFQYGDLVQISGKLEKPQNFTSSSSKDFDYISYLGKDDIYYQMSFAKVTFTSSGHGNFLKSILFRIKNSFIENTDKAIPEPEQSLLSGILLGAKHAMRKDITAMFRVAGISHIVALSGYNISVVSKAIMGFFSFLPRAVGFSFGTIGIILFVIMSGASSTAVRAGIMALIVILAGVTRRNYNAGRALIIAGLLMVLINPKILVFDVSFQLSFLATIAIIYVAPILKKKLYFVTERFLLRDTIASTISAQILVLPLILYKMGLMSFVALPVNILVLPFIPAIMLFGFITGMLGFVSMYLAFPFAWISWFLLAYIIKIAGLFASLPFASANISWFSPILMIICYIFITFWILKERSKARL